MCLDPKENSRKLLLDVYSTGRLGLWYWAVGVCPEPVGEFQTFYEPVAVEGGHKFFNTFNEEVGSITLRTLC